MAVHGYKSYSHECLISFLEEYYPIAFDDFQIHFLDSMRKLRIDIQYRGRNTADDYLERNSLIIEKIIEILLELVKNELNA